MRSILLLFVWPAIFCCAENILFAGLGDPVRLDSEILHLDAPSRTCPEPADFSHQIQSAVGGFINESGNERILVCNGFDDITFRDSRLCFEHFFSNLSWSRSAFQTNVGRLRPAATMLDDRRLFITGGQSNINEPLSSTEIFDNGAFGFGPNMPLGVFDHCTVHIGMNKTLVIGGKTELGVADPRAWSYDWTRDSWTELGDIMQTPREGHACASNSDGSKVVIAGGNSAGIPNDSVDILDTATGMFVPGPRLPVAITDGTLLLQEDGTFLYVGGYGSTISYSKFMFELNLTANTWKQRSDTLAAERTRFIGAMIPVSVVNCL